MKKPLEAVLRGLLARYADLPRWERIVALEHVLCDERNADNVEKTKSAAVIEARDVLLEANPFNKTPPAEAAEVRHAMDVLRNAGLEFFNP